MALHNITSCKGTKTHFTLSHKDCEMHMYSTRHKSFEPTYRLVYDELALKQTNVNYFQVNTHMVISQYNMPHNTYLSIHAVYILDIILF